MFITTSHGFLRQTLNMCSSASAEKQLICFIEHTEQKETLFCEKELTSLVFVLNYNDIGHPWVIKAAWGPQLLVVLPRLAYTMGKVRLLVLLCVFCASAYLHRLLSRKQGTGTPSFPSDI